MSRLRIVLAQLNMTVGDIEGNCQNIKLGMDEARALGADVIAFEVV